MRKLPIEKWMELIDEITTQMTEIAFSEPCIELKNDLDDDIRFMYTDEAQDFYNERYDEVETLLKNMLEGYINIDRKNQYNNIYA